MKDAQVFPGKFKEIDSLWWVFYSRHLKSGKEGKNKSDKISNRMNKSED